MWDQVRYLNKPKNTLNSELNFLKRQTVQQTVLFSDKDFENKEKTLDNSLYDLEISKLKRREVTNYLFNKKFFYELKMELNNLFWNQNFETLENWKQSIIKSALKNLLKKFQKNNIFLYNYAFSFHYKWQNINDFSIYEKDNSTNWLYDILLIDAWNWTSITPRCYYIIWYYWVIKYFYAIDWINADSILQLLHNDVNLLRDHLFLLFDYIWFELNNTFDFANQIFNKNNVNTIWNTDFKTLNNEKLFEIFKPIWFVNQEKQDKTISDINEQISNQNENSMLKYNFDKITNNNWRFYEEIRKKINTELYSDKSMPDKTDTIVENIKKLFEENWDYNVILEDNYIFSFNTEWKKSNYYNNLISDLINDWTDWEDSKIDILSWIWQSINKVQDYWRLFKNWLYNILILNIKKHDKLLYHDFNIKENKELSWIDSYYLIWNQENIEYLIRIKNLSYWLLLKLVWKDKHIIYEYLLDLLLSCNISYQIIFEFILWKMNWCNISIQ